MAANAASGWWSRAAALGRRLEDWLLVALLGALIFIGAAQIVLRNVFSMGVTWGDGLVRLLVLWLALAGAVAASRDGRHITMGALIRWLTPSRQRVALVAAELFAAAVSAAFAWYALAFVRDSYIYEDVVLDGVPAWLVQAPIPAAFALIALRYLGRVTRRLRGEAT